MAASVSNGLRPRPPGWEYERWFSRDGLCTGVSSAAVETTDVTDDTDELENLRITLPAAEVAPTSLIKLADSWSEGVFFTRLICGVCVAIDPMLRVFTTSCSALARVAKRLASRMLFFVTW